MTLRGGQPAALPGGDVEHPGIRSEPKPFAEQPDLLRAGRILNIMLGFCDGVEPRHALSLPRCNGLLEASSAGGGKRGCTPCPFEDRRAVQLENVGCDSLDGRCDPSDFPSSVAV
jgi:hypothetical protein